MAKIEYRKKENGEIWSCMVPDDQVAAKAAELTAAGCVDIRYPHTLDATIGPSKNPYAWYEEEHRGDE